MLIRGWFPLRGSMAPRFYTTGVELATRRGTVPVAGVVGLESRSTKGVSPIHRFSPPQISQREQAHTYTPENLPVRPPSHFADLVVGAGLASEYTPARGDCHCWAASSVREEVDEGPGGDGPELRALRLVAAERAGQLAPGDVVVDVRVVFAELSYIQANELHVVGAQPLSRRYADLAALRPLEIQHLSWPFPRTVWLPDEIVSELQVVASYFVLSVAAIQRPQPSMNTNPGGICSDLRPRTARNSPSTQSRVYKVWR